VSKAIINRTLDCISSSLSISRMKLLPDSKIGDFPQWDSLGHINIYFALQKEFDVHIPLTLAGNVKSVDDWARIIEKIINFENE